MRTSGLLIAVPIVACLLCAPVSAQVTQRVSVNSRGAPADRLSYAVSMTPDGRYVVFQSPANNLVPGDTNGTWDVFVRDRQNGTTERVSVASNGVQGNAESFHGAISDDGRYVVFTSLANNLVPADTNNTDDVFLHDRTLGTTRLVSVDAFGTQGNFDSFDAQISGDGRFVAFISYADNLVPSDTNDSQDYFVHDRRTGVTERVDVSSNGAQAIPFFGDGFSCGISSDGDTNAESDVFVHDRLNGRTERVSVASNGTQQIYDYGYKFIGCSISSDGRYVAFNSPADNLVPGDTNGTWDIFVHDRQNGLTERVSVGSQGVQGNAGSGWLSWISAGGRYVAFWSGASNLVPGDTNGYEDVFVRDRRLGTTERVNLSSSSEQANDHSANGIVAGSADGRFILFDSVATNLVPAVTDGFANVFVRDRVGGTNFTSLCDPGVAGVVSCPCSNAPSGPDRGCENSSGTGGGSLSASGGTFLSSDSLVFTTSGEKPTATSALLEGNVFYASGIVYGQGVRCVGGATKRLFTKTAVAGSITAPDFGAGDPTVSVRSAAKGDVIQPGQSRYYLVYYRDPNVPGGCPATSTFNATQTGQVTWWP